MEVPFKVIMDYTAEYQYRTYCKKFSQIQYAEKLEIGESTYKNYYSGKRENTKKAAYPKNKYFNTFFENLCIKLYDITLGNYESKAKAMLHYLEINKKNSSRFIDIAKYTQDLDDEYVPVYKQKEPNYDERLKEFLERCVLHEFLKNYIKLCGNDDYMNYQISSSEGDGETPPFLLYEYHEDTYMNQSLKDESNQVVFAIDIDDYSCDFSFFEKNRLTIITGPGGQGKTEFLYVLHMINEMTESCFDDVIIIPLIDLTLYQKSVDNIKKDWIREYIKSKYRHVDLDNESKKYLVLLDGINEYTTASNNQTINKITQDINCLIKQVSSPNNDRLSVAVTSRDEVSVRGVLGNIDRIKTLKLTGTSDAVYQHIKRKCANDRIPFEGEEIGRLARIPLYALLIEHMDDEELRNINSQYALLDIVYHNRVDQRIGDEAHKSAYDKSLYLYLYYVYLPFAAHQTVISDRGDNTYYFSGDDSRDYLSSLTANQLDAILLETVFHTDHNIKTIPCIPNIDVFRLGSFLCNEESDVIKQTDTINRSVFRFSHEVWRDYLTAKFLNTVVIALKERYDSKNQDNILCLLVSYNIGTDAAQMVLQSFGLCSDPVANASRIEKLFKVDSTKIRRTLFGSIGLMHTAFEFNEYLKVCLPCGEKKENTSLHRIMESLWDFLSKNHQYDKKIKNKQIITDCICEILSKESEYHRLTGKYDWGFKIVELALEYDPNSKIILNQKAKMYLSCFESKLNHDLNVDYPVSIKGKNLMELYENGVNLLSELASTGFHLSANIAGTLKSTVAPVLIKNLPEIKADFCGAFRCYAEVIYRTDYVRRDISYTIRQAVNLLIKRYVSVSEDSSFEPENDMTCLDNLKLEVCNLLLSQNINKESLTLAENMITKATGQGLEGLNYLRGAILLYSGQKEKAKPFFETRFNNESTLMSDIQLKYQYHVDGLDNKIQKQFEALINDIKNIEYGQYDRTHPAYWYIESRELLLSYLDDKELEKKAKNYFSDLEKDKPVNEIVNMVFDFIHQN